MSGQHYSHPCRENSPENPRDQEKIVFLQLKQEISDLKHAHEQMCEDLTKLTKKNSQNGQEQDGH